MLTKKQVNKMNKFQLYWHLMVANMVILMCDIKIFYLKWRIRTINKQLKHFGSSMLNQKGYTLVELLIVICVFIAIPTYIFGVPYLVWKAYLYAVVAPFHTPSLTYWQVFAILFILQVLSGFLKVSFKHKE